ncbi:MAG: cobalamin biosynthesis protein [Candidatus Omnitrophica bacterium]|nr:cobalamin biosynthesis protein [Candidatus Omnitrophota bacterium]MDD5236433.1 cobalamin biosynthesis protein [Candidatus Omnitrophota bacterium]
MKTTTKLWIAIAVLILFSPLGLILPERFKAGGAWGEWSIDAIKELIGYIPEGLKKMSNLWKAPIPDYAFQGWEEKGLGNLSIAYIASAVLGIAVVALVVFSIGKFLSKKN